MRESKIISLEDYKRTLEPVCKPSYNLNLLVEFFKELEAAYGFVSGSNTTFAHVLNIGPEDLWPGDVAIFYPELFSLRLSDTWLYQDTSHFAEHKRYETQRRCQAYASPLPYFDYDFFRCLGAHLPDAVMQREEEDVDTLNSELLLTEEYVLPQDVKPFGKKPDF